MVNLRDVNPYVAAAIGDMKSMAAHAPRQLAPGVLLAVGDSCIPLAVYIVRDLCLGGGGDSAQSRVSHESVLIKCWPLQGQNAAGTSSFGMSGVNAHTVLCPVETQVGAEQQRSLLWQRARHWFAPAQHAMLALSAKSGNNIIIVARLGCASTAYLHDHQVSCSAHNQSKHLLGRLYLN